MLFSHKLQEKKNYLHFKQGKNVSKVFCYRFFQHTLFAEFSFLLFFKFMFVALALKEKHNIEEFRRLRLEYLVYYEEKILYFKEIYLSHKDSSFNLTSFL